MVKRIAVIGDLMLDKYDYCTNRQNPESSAPCYTIVKTEYKPGGAGNVAANLRSLGSDSILISVVGKDADASILEKELDKAGIASKLICDSQRPTIVKERTMSVQDGRYHFRKDRELKRYIDANHVSEIMNFIGGYDVGLVLVSDYNKGTISEVLMEQLKKIGIPLIVDPKPAHKNFYKNVFLLTPNVSEAREMSGLESEIEAAEKLREEFGCNVLLTRGQDGISFFGKGEDSYSYPAQAKKVFDVTGAGDTVNATLAHFYIKGSTMKEAICLANKAAGIAVGYPGCYCVTEEEVLRQD